MNDAHSAKTLANDPGSCPGHGPGFLAASPADPKPCADSVRDPDKEIEENLKRFQSLSHDADDTLIGIRCMMHRMYLLTWTFFDEIHPRWGVKRIPDDKTARAQARTQYAYEATESVAKVFDHLHAALESLNVDGSLPETVQMVADTIVDSYSRLERYCTEQAEMGKLLDDWDDKARKENQRKEKEKRERAAAGIVVEGDEETPLYDDIFFPGFSPSLEWVRLDVRTARRVLIHKLYGCLVEQVFERGQDTGDTGGEGDVGKEGKKQQFAAQAAILARPNVRDDILAAMEALTTAAGGFYTPFIVGECTGLGCEYLDPANDKVNDTVKMTGTSVRNVSKLYVDYAHVVAKMVVEGMDEAIEQYNKDKQNIPAMEATKVTEAEKTTETAKTTEAAKITDVANPTTPTPVPQIKAPVQQQETERASWWCLFRKKRKAKGPDGV